MSDQLLQPVQDTVVKETVPMKVLHKDFALIKTQFDGEVDVTIGMFGDQLSAKILDVSLLKADAEYESDYLKLQEEVTFAKLFEQKTQELSALREKKPTISDIENAVKGSEEYQSMYLRKIESQKNAKYLQSILFDLINRREKQ